MSQRDVADSALVSAEGLADHEGNLAGRPDAMLHLQGAILPALEPRWEGIMLYERACITVCMSAASSAFSQTGGRVRTTPDSAAIPRVPRTLGVQHDVAHAHDNFVEASMLAATDKSRLVGSSLRSSLRSLRASAARRRPLRVPMPLCSTFLTALPVGRLSVRRRPNNHAYDHINDDMCVVAVWHRSGIRVPTDMPQLLKRRANAV